MNDFITEAWLRANHTLSEGGEIHLPADAAPLENYLSELSQKEEGPGEETHYR
ncbi:cob(I)yrinic acid a,c-diamide adenosyltransferase [Klebsiella pneumoniae]|nr:cob(I)yrinic acid a,c-diamide adenosyltransferase [Klebsiella pneumoniae]